MTRFLLTTAIASVLALTGCMDVTTGTNAYALSGGDSLRGSAVSFGAREVLAGAQTFEISFTARNGQRCERNS